MVLFPMSCVVETGHHQRKRCLDMESELVAAVEETVLRLSRDVHLCVEVIGDCADPTVLLIGGATWSMDWWDEDLCQQMADRGRRVARYDQRDTGRATSYPSGSPGYTGADLVHDAVAVLDGIGVDRAHVVGLSMGGGVAQRLAMEHPDRVASLTLISTTPIDTTIVGLPGPTPEIQATFLTPDPEPDWHDREAVVDYIVEGERPYAGPDNFDEAKLRTVAGRVFDRTNDMAACMTNHFLLEDGSSGDYRLSRLAGIPTLVLHGTADPMFPLSHGEALAESIPGARFIELDGVGHQLPPPKTWDLVLDAHIAHTAGA